MFVAWIGYPCKHRIRVSSRLTQKMNNEGNARCDVTHCVVCEVHSRVVEALTVTLADWGLANEPRRLLAPRHGCGTGPPRRADCPFVDGWMDEVAYALLDSCTATGGGLPPGMQADFDRQQRASLAAAVAMVRLERQKAADTRNPLRAQWELGAEAARVLRRFYESCAPEEQETLRKRVALTQLVGLTYRILGTPTTPAGLRRIVNSGLLAGQCGVTFMRIPERAELLRLLTQPIVDVAKWVGRLESLWRTFPI
jgi:hypothetical protein